ncbi:MAG: DUF6624 domain-containing protein [Chloroflexota bacterium]
MSEAAIECGALADEIVQMAEVDQAMRQRAMTGGGWDAAVDAQNTRRLKEIVQDIGWPTRSKVGQRASYLVWLLVQHADHDAAFQRECLQLMQAPPAGEVDPRNIAYLEDRVRVNEGRPQRYGTQFCTDVQGQFGPRPVEDPDQLDERRRAVGLEPFEAYRRLMMEHVPRPVR